MKSNNKLKQCLMLLLCVVMAAGALTQTAGAAEPTGNCTNPHTQGIEYFAPMATLAEDANKWRGELEVKGVLADGVEAGTVLGVEVEVINSGLRYQCTKNQNIQQHFSCNSMPINAVISGVYILFRPDVAENTDINFTVRDVNAIKYDGTPEGPFWSTSAKIKFPPYPCSVNYEFLDDFVHADGSTLVFYTNGNDCGSSSIPIGSQVVEFREKDPKYAIVNIIESSELSEDRIKVEALPNANFDFKLDLVFLASDADKDEDKSYLTVTYSYDYDPVTKISTSTTSAVSTYKYATTKFDNSVLPLTLVSGKMYDLKAEEEDGWGKKTFPSDIDLLVRFWYENTTGTLGYENSIYHFERNLNIQFAPTCKQTASSSTLYDPCQQSQQGFSAQLNSHIVIPVGTELYYGSNKKVAVKNTSDDQKVVDDLKNLDISTEGYPMYFITRKCVNATCDWVTGTSALLRTINISDGGGSNHTYTYRQSSGSTWSRFNIKPYGTSAHPFSITSVLLVATEPGTYVVYPFARYSAREKTMPQKNSDYYGDPIYITINDKDSLDTCQTLANNGYFKALWNDCLSPSETQLLTFEHIAGKEEAWMENRSNTAVYFPYVQKWSYIPQALQIASLTYKAEALAGSGRPGEAYCTPAGCYVPPYTKVTITGGTMYLDGYPKYDEYYVAYAREQTWNISHLFFSIQAQECKTKKIPDTGISLRSPLKVDPKVDAATRFAFTDNRLQIPAIGLGMGEVPPIPIVHIYYEDDSDNMRWDLSTLGNYVGELEGGSYIPYGGNSVLTGHFWSQGVFVNLKNLNYEDEVIIYANDGIKYIYKVVEKFIAQPNDVYEMFQQIGERSLTLVTCENYNMNTDEYERRYIVRAVIDSQEPYEKTW